MAPKSDDESMNMLHRDIMDISDTYRSDIGHGYWYSLGELTDKGVLERVGGAGRGTYYR